MEINLKPVIISNRNKIKYNEEWNKCIQLRTPFFVILKSIKYASIKYDMFPIPFNLSEESVNKIINIYNNFENMHPDALKKKDSFANISNELGYIPEIEFSKAKYLSYDIFKIVHNSMNWISIPSINELLENDA